MTKARQNRLREARAWFPAQGFTDDSHDVKAYRKKFSVDRVCAMRELCLLGMLSPDKQKAYEEQLAARDRKQAEKQARRKARDTEKTLGMDSFLEQDDHFYFIAGYTSGGAPYGITWEEAENEGLI